MSQKTEVYLLPSRYMKQEPRKRASCFISVLANTGFKTAHIFFKRLFPFSMIYTLSAILSPRC